MAASSQDDAVDVTALADYFGDLAPKWATLGIKLGQADCVRELIRLKDMTQEDKCVAVLQSWVDSGTDVSWTNLCSLLRSKGVELEEVAKQVQQVSYRLANEMSSYIPVRYTEYCYHMYHAYVPDLCRHMCHKRSKQGQHQSVSSICIFCSIVLKCNTLSSDADSALYCVQLAQLLQLLVVKHHMTLGSANMLHLQILPI